MNKICYINLIITSLFNDMLSSFSISHKSEGGYYIDHLIATPFLRIDNKVCNVSHIFVKSFALFLF